ncbi:unnamed protein product [Pylaiella littoralis]
MLRKVIAEAVASTRRRTSPAHGKRHLHPGRGSATSSSWQEFLCGGLHGISQTSVQTQQGGGGERVHISWVDGHESEFATKWLRDHCSEAVNPHTKQRQVDTYAVPNDIRVREVSVTTKSTAAAAAATGDDHSTDDQPGQVLRLSWSGSGSSSGSGTIPVAWLRQHCTSPSARDLRQRYGAATDGASCRPCSVLWGADVFSLSRPSSSDNNALRDDAAAAADPTTACIMHYDEVMKEEEEDGHVKTHQNPPSPSPPSSARGGSARHLVDLIRSRGIALVRGVPTTEEGTEALALKLGGHLRSTLYGPGMWATSAEASAGEEAFRDSAYSSDALALHTDCGYLADPPGIQVFNCVVRANKGGASIYVDGFAVAERLRQENPEAFEFFSRTPISYQCFDEGCHYMAEGPVFRLGAHGQVFQVRHNDYDRAPLDYLSTDDVDRFYEHHTSLSKIIRDPSLVARIVLEPGECVILDNQRAMHGRESFKGRRRMVGCYLGMDELHSEARVHRM